MAQLDAAIMRGADHSFGAVGALEGYGLNVASTPGSFSYAEKRAWYALSVHVSRIR